ncbi:MULTISPECIES: hypothetical protein [Acinetobacter calcoaceticus/baumannii complex]|uniref:hypothetical protein n=1 Tax=Acinetobacter calcoaceticus/baumannii complex TaxID=909768 RepID=UPI000A9577F1|nr:MULTISPECIES: hypothetical protein [Acinetobacter calcoaceticus/baumannii complex]MCG9491766.1 hypothetical protein [Acinetobacter pittii]MCU4347233.1 hypothetical protein [Acinetobacter lactucae]
MKEKSKAQAVTAQKFVSYDSKGGGFKFHNSLEDAEKASEANLDYYREGRKEITSS